MKKILFSKILSTILVLSLVLSVFIPMGTIAGAAAETKAPDYSSTLNVDTLAADGWKAAFSSNPQGGVPFADVNIKDYYETWGKGAANIIRRMTTINYSNNWNNANTFSNMGALTYTTKKYKYFTLTVDYKYGKKNDSDTAYKNYPRPIISFNQQNTTPEMFYKTSTAVPSPTYGEDPIGVFFEYEGHINVSGKKTGTKRTAVASGKEIESINWHKAKITVTPGNVHVAVYNTDGTMVVESNSTLSADYEGGYISLMQNGISFFGNLSITEVDLTGDYSNVLKVSEMATQGWKAAYSADPQHDVPFTEVDFSKAFEYWNPGLFISQKNGILWGRDDSNPYQKMSAATYTAQKYKYFTLTVDYKYEQNNRPWPVITFNQPNEIPEIHYREFNKVPSPTSGDDAIGVHFEYEGAINVSAKKMSKTRKEPTTSLNGKEWHKAEITVTPGKAYIAVYNTDGTVANEVTKDLPDDYEGGYISLMLNGWSAFKNISITEHPEISIDNYYGTPDGNGGIATDKIFVERTYGENVDYKEVLIVPERAGYNFMGFYSDESYENAVDLEATIDRKATVYAKWSDFADITADGNVNLKDLVRIKKMAVNEISATVAADLDFDGTNANGTDITVLRNKLLGEAVQSNVAVAAELMDAGILYPLGRTMVLENAVEMDHVNTGFVLKGEFEGDVKAEFDTNRIGTLLNVSINGGANKVIDMPLEGLTTLATDLPKGEYTIEVTSGTSTRYTTTPDTERGTQAYDGTLKLKKLYYSGMPVKYESDKTSRILFIGDSITCGMGLDTTVADGGYKASNAYYSYASVLGRMLNAEVEVNARCGAKVCHFVWADCGASNNEGRGKGLCNGIDWLKSINVRNSTEYDYANNQPDLVVINLGTNDIPYEKDENGKWVGIWDDTGNKYSEEVPPLLNRVHTLYPNAKIIWTVGMMDRKTEISQEYIGYFKSYVETWSADHDNAAYFLDLSNVADRTGHSGHPTIEGHNAAAEELYKFIDTNNIGINSSSLADLDSAEKKN